MIFTQDRKALCSLFSDQVLKPVIIKQSHFSLAYIKQHTSLLTVSIKFHMSI